MKDTVDVAIVGAGPYGLSLGAHLRAAGVSFRQFGLVMNLWRNKMPKGMFLKSQGFASNLSDPAGTHTLEAFCAATGRTYARYGQPVPLDTFVAYGQWFQAELVPDLEQTLVSGITPRDGGFELELENGDTVSARQVVVAAGVEHFPYLPKQFAELPGEVCTHASQHTDLADFSGRRVVVVGGGQSALETAALLHETGADVQVAVRKPAVAWNTRPLDPHRPLLQRLREPEAGLGSGYGTWLYSNHPGLFRRLPQSTRIYRARTALGPAGATWLRDRVEGEFPVLTGHNVRSARVDGEGIRITLAGSGGEREVTADHLIAATGYRPDLGRLRFIGDSLRPAIRTVAKTPAVDKDYQSSVPGLYFAGPGVAPTFGPVMRFVFGSDHAAHRLAARLIRTAGTRSSVSVKVA
jgi:cation diffusion facilitator CzcD-associated flavoprotein CzcO